MFKSELLDNLAQWAANKPLPGRWGVVQSLCDTWSSNVPSRDTWVPFKVLWGVKAVLASVGAVREYQQAKEPQVRERDLFDLFFKEKNLVETGLSYWVGVIHTALSCATHIDIQVNPKKPERFLRQYTTHSGECFYLLIHEETSLDFLGFYCTKRDFPVVLKYVRELVWASMGSSRISFFVESSSITGDEAIVLGPTKQTLPVCFDTEGVHANIRKRALQFAQCGLVRGVLLYGPPGTGKTTLATHLFGNTGRVLQLTPQAVADTSAAALQNVVFLLEPSVLIFDDIDRLENSDFGWLLSTLEELHRNPPPGGMIIVGTVNTLDSLDPALLRSGRFDDVLEVLEPEPAQLRNLVQHYIQVFGKTLLELDVDVVTQAMQGFSPADVHTILETLSAVGVEHLEVEVDRVRRQRELYRGGQVAEYLKAARAE